MTYRESEDSGQDGEPARSPEDVDLKETRLCDDGHVSVAQISQDAVAEGKSTGRGNQDKHFSGERRMTDGHIGEENRLTKRHHSSGDIPLRLKRVSGEFEQTQRYLDGQTNYISLRRFKTFFSGKVSFFCPPLPHPFSFNLCSASERVCSYIYKCARTQKDSDFVYTCDSGRRCACVCDRANESGRTWGIENILVFIIYIYPHAR